MPTLEQLSHHLNAAWTIAMALWVYLMHAGFGFYEAGMCRRKNTVDTLSHNLIILAISLVAYWLIGFGLMYGNGNGFIGLTGFAPETLAGKAGTYASLDIKPVSLVVVLAFALSFCDTPATLIAGTGAERIKLIAVAAMTIVISGFIFPVVGHWVAGGGWLSKLPTPVYDIGSGFLQLTGGACALAVALLLGPRRGRFKRDEDEPAKAIAPSSMPFVFLGGFLLWMGFFAYSAGYSMAANAGIGLAVVNTALAGGFGAVTGMLGSWLLTGKAELRATIVALLTAGVASTSPSAVVAPWAGAAIGIIAGAATLGSIRLWAALHIDDPTEYLTMNIVGGVIGMTAVGLFASPAIIARYHPASPPQPGLVYGHIDQLLSQWLGTAAIGAFALVAAFVAAAALRAVGWLRVSPHEEEEGSDKATHGESADGEDEGGNEGGDEDEREPQP
ncbi:MAG TPA: hypothetical protein VFH57_04480 [Gammaproteobacteria bacterium]|nr:hypothetical protein [Gammaproteobacteria bacterium]